MRSDKIVLAVMSVLLLSVAAHAAEKANCTIKVPTREEIVATDRMTTLMAEYGPVSIMLKNQIEIVEDSKELYAEKNVSDDDCVKMVQASNNAVEVLLKRAEKVRNEYLRSKLIERMKFIVQGNNAYIKYYKGSMPNRVEAEKFWQQADTCEKDIQHYIRGE